MLSQGEQLALGYFYIIQSGPLHDYKVWRPLLYCDRAGINQYPKQLQGAVGSKSRPTFFFFFSLRWLQGASFSWFTRSRTDATQFAASVFHLLVKLRNYKRARSTKQKFQVRWRWHEAHSQVKFTSKKKKVCLWPGIHTRGQRRKCNDTLASLLQRRNLSAPASTYKLLRL